jgi:hypothetical protein
MNILKFKHHVLRDSWGTGGSDGSAGSMNSDSSSNTRSWSDASGTVTTNPYTGGISWTGTSGNLGGSFTDPNFNTPVQQPVETEEQKAQKLADEAENQRLVQRQQFALNKMEFDNKNPNYVQGLSQMPQMQKSLGQMYSGYTTGSQFNVQNNDQAQSASDAAGQSTSPSIWHRLGLRAPGTTSDSFLNSETPSQRADRMGIVGDSIGGVGKAMISAMMPAPMRMAISGLQAYDKYKQNPDIGVGHAVASGLQGAGGYVGSLANMYNGNYGAALTGALGKNGVTGDPAAIAGIGLDYGLGKNIAPSLGGLAGQFVGRSIGGSGQAGANLGTFGKSLGQQMSRRASIRK